MPALSPLAPTHYATLPPIDGVTLAAGEAGIRYKNRVDVLYAEFTPGTTVAGVLTRSLCPSPAVDGCKRNLPQGQARALVVNSGNSYAFTGKAGDASLHAIETAAAQVAGCTQAQIFTSATGVIGEPIDHTKITGLLPALKANLTANAWDMAARAIMTTDTCPKLATRTAQIGGVEVRLNGIAKGSGMIAPDMATMLAFVFTDAAIPAPALQAMLARANARSFNCITVDGDTSTSDTCLAFATGKAGNTDADNTAFEAALTDLLTELAQAIVKDGEGASKFITLRVQGAEHDEAARRIALSIGNSPLVKTALAAGDANWGRIVAAIGKAGEKAERDRLTLDIGGIRVAEQGQVSPAYNEADLAPHMQGQEIDIKVNLNIGSGQTTVWTCDLTHAYIDINGSYRS